MAVDKASVSVSASVLPEDIRVEVGGSVTHEIADGVQQVK
jgi:hypothetical protein